MTEKAKTIYIKKERAEQIIRNRHPWIFSGAVLKIPSEDIEPGEIVKVASDDGGTIIGCAAFNPLSEIRLRMITWQNGDTAFKVADKNYFENLFLATARRKEKLLQFIKNDHSLADKNYRLIHGESDGIPGLIVDRYGEVFVIQCQTAFAQKYLTWWVDIIKNLFKPAAIYDKSDTCPNPRRQEGLKSFSANGRILSGALPPKNFEILDEDGFRIKIDIPGGQKTGYYLDLRNARRTLEKYISLANSKKVLNLFGYTGSFNLYAARGGATHILQIDSSESACALALENARLNKIPDGNITVKTGDVFEYLDNLKDSHPDETFDCIILDPPSLARTAKDKRAALEALTHLNAIALDHLNNGGLLFTFSCSSHIREEDFSRMIFLATRRGNSAKHSRYILLEKMYQGIDHTVIPEFPEGRYLEGMVIQKFQI